MLTERPRYPMKKYIHLHALLLFSLFLLSSLAGAQVKPTIAVLSFEAKNVSQETADAVADILSTELFNTQRFQVIERQAMLRILDEQKLQMTGVTDMGRAVEIGKVLNVQKIMIGSVSKLGDTYIINTRLVDVKTGALELAQNAKSTTGEEGLTNAISDLVKIVAQKMAVEGSIIKITGDVMLIDLGSNHGLIEGQILAVVRMGESVTDLKGNVIGQSEDVIGSLLVKSVKADYSETGVDDRKTAFKLGDKVRMTNEPVKIIREEEPKPKKEVKYKKVGDDKDKGQEAPPTF
jgi:TolB-like protein